MRGSRAFEAFGPAPPPALRGAAAHSPPPAFFFCCLLTIDGTLRPQRRPVRSLPPTPLSTSPPSPSSFLPRQLDLRPPLIRPSPSVSASDLHLRNISCRTTLSPPPARHNSLPPCQQPPSNLPAGNLHGTLLNSGEVRLQIISIFYRSSLPRTLAPGPIPTRSILVPASPRRLLVFMHWLLTIAK